jgi:hypothetical protein
MLRYNALLVALGGLAIVAVAPRHGADAQSGQALAFAEHACFEYGVTPHTKIFESCVVRAARAFDRGEPDLAYSHARLTRDAGDACRSYGLAPDAQRYGDCVATQVDRRTRR